MSKLQFLLAENPLQQEQGVYILHTQWPQMLIKCIHRDEHPEYIIPEHQFWIEFDYRSKLDNNHEAVILCVQLLFNVNDFTEAITIQDDIFKVLKRAKRWYISYMMWEDDNIINDKI